MGQWVIPHAAWLRFAQKTRPDPCGCLLWTAYKNQDGYGHFWWNGKAWYAHRLILVWSTCRGEDPGPEWDAHHTCNAGCRSCVDPRHLEWREAGEHRREDGRKYRGRPRDTAQAV